MRKSFFIIFFFFVLFETKHNFSVFTLNLKSINEINFYLELLEFGFEKKEIFFLNWEKNEGKKYNNQLYSYKKNLHGKAFYWEVLVFFEIF